MAALSKGTLLWVPFQETSAFHACFSLLRRCRDAGYRCVVVVFDKFAAYLNQHGFETAVIDVQALEAKTLAKGKARLIELDAHVSARFEAIVAELKPRLVLLDQMLWWRASIVAKANIPLLMLSNTYAGTVNRSVPPVCSPLQPGSGLLSRLQRTLAWLALGMWPQSNCNNETLWSLWFSTWFRRQRRAVQAAGLRLAWGEYGYRIRGPELVLAPQALDFGLCQELRHYAGACLDVSRDETKRLEAGKTTFVMPSLDQRPLIYVSFGSYRFFKGRMRAYQALLDWMGGRDDLQMVMQIPEDEAQSLEFPAHVHAMSWAPQLQLLERAALFITHGGLSSLKEACYFATPLLVIPFFNDGFGNGARVVHHGLGSMLLQGDLNRARIEACISKILSEPLQARQCERLRQGLLAEQSCEAGLACITAQICQA